MAINFPDSPIDGNQYTYNDIVYTYKKSGANEGYWTVLTPSSVGVATPTEINEGTDNQKYASPQGLAGSKYVREDEASGETVLNADGLERLKATAQGVEATGTLKVSGEININGEGNIAAYVIAGDYDSVNGMYWRTWSDGFKEHWGTKIINAGSTATTLTFTNPYTNVPSMCRQATNTDFRFSVDNTVGFSNESTTSILLHRIGSTAQNINISWKISGY